MKKIVFVFVLQFFVGFSVSSQDDLVDLLLELKLGQELSINLSKQVIKEKSKSMYIKHTHILKFNNQEIRLRLDDNGDLTWFEAKTDIQSVINFYYRNLCEMGACDFGYLIISSQGRPNVINDYAVIRAFWNTNDSNEKYELISQLHTNSQCNIEYSIENYALFITDIEEIPKPEIPTTIQLHITDQNSTAFIPFDIGIVPFHGYFTNEELPLREDVGILVNKIEERGMLEFKASNGWDYMLYFHTNKGGFPVKVEIENISSEEAYEIIDSFIQFQGCFPWPFRRTEYIKDGPLKEQKAGGIHHLSACFQQTFPAYRIWFDYDPLFKRLIVKKEITQSEYRKFKEATDFCPFTERDNLRCVNISEEEWRKMLEK